MTGAGSAASSKPPPASPGTPVIDRQEWPFWGAERAYGGAPFASDRPGARGQIQTPVGLSLSFEVTRWEPEYAGRGGSPAQRRPGIA